MDSRTQERVERWDSRPFDGDLHALAGADFSGAVVGDGTWLFLLGGRVVGVIDGEPGDVAGGSGTVYEAPHRALPLLCSMEARRGAPRGQYYTNETPLEEVDDTLQEGSFTGYVELSENVLSGDYYLVYYGGRRMAVAYIGNAERLLVGEEAFERAVDEVGIYDVIDVEVEVTDVADAVEIPSTADGRDASASGTDDSDSEPDREPRASVGSDPAASNVSASAAASAETSSADDDEPAGTNGIAEEARWQESRTIPSVDSESDGDVADAPNATTGAAEDPSASPSDGTDPDSDGPPDSAEPSAGDGAVETMVPSEGSDRSDESDPETVEDEREQLRARNRELSATVERLRSRMETLEADLEEARGGRSSSSGPDLGIDEALSQTNLFVRYDSRSQPTLGTAHEDRVDRSEVDANLRLEYHTRFDDAGATVDGVPFAEALTDSMEFRFLEWLTTELFFEIRDTGRADALGTLYEGITRIDRVELRSELPIETDAEDGSETVEFDVVAYDKMGHPLLVAVLNDSREPASRELLESVAADASAVADRHSELAAALVVTRSYFEPGALEVVEEATKSGFLSRGSRLSYVNNAGYHLCLAESRSEGFHMTVPEL